MLRRVPHIAWIDLAEVGLTLSVTTKKNDAALDTLQLNYNQERSAQGATPL
jgi:hypothetical protein